MTPHCGLHIELGCVVVARPLPEVQDTQTLSIMGALGRMCLRVVGVAGCCKLLPGSRPPAALEPGELSSILIVEYDNDVYDNDDSDDNDNGDDNDAKLHSPLRWLTFAVRLKELTRGILDAISIRRRQGCSHEPSQREPILVELGKGSCISRSSFSFSSEAGGTFGRREPAAAAASALGPAEGMAAFGAFGTGADPASAAAAGAVASETMWPPTGAAPLPFPLHS